MNIAFSARADARFLYGTEALALLPILQRQRDRAAGLNTAGFISGYRGSPLGALDQILWRRKAELGAENVHFEPGLNEDLAATAVWGSQQVNLFEGALYDGVFGLWYGKGPGVDRSMDVFKHANAAGSSRFGGVLAVAGDDHAARSSTLPHQSEHMFAAAMIPVLNPSSVQEILDFGLHGWAMSRYSGCWVALKATADTVESYASVSVDPFRIRSVIPKDFALPPDGLNIRWPDPPLAQELRLQHAKVYAAMAYARANGLDRLIFGSPRARLGIVATGKSYLDVRQALEDLGIDARPRRNDRAAALQGRDELAARRRGHARVRRGPRRNSRCRGEAPAHRIPAQGASLQLARRRAPARDRQICRRRRMGSAAARLAIAGGGGTDADADRKSHCRPHRAFLHRRDP